MNSSRIFQSLRFNNRFLLQLRKTTKLHRTFLSEAYQCQEAWNKRMNSSLLQKIKPINFFVEIEQKYQNKNEISAIDIDIFANVIQDKEHANELADILHKLRNTKETSNTLDSTHHAVIRYYLSIGKAEEVVEILNDRLNYGIFCDYFCYNLLMDHFIKKQDFASAAKIASFLMLQEEFEHPISNALAIYSCHKYLENPDTWQEEDPEVLRLQSEPKEEVKVRVHYIRNPYFDDHFDLWKPSDLVGKTLFWIGQTMNNVIGRSSHLRGLVLYRKYSDAIKLLKQWEKEGIKEVIYKDVLHLIKNDVPEIFKDETNEEIKELQQLLMNLENADLHPGSFSEDIEKLIMEAVDANSQEDILKQTRLYNEWEEKRMQILKQHLAEIDKKARLEKVEAIKKDLVEKERFLTFFENEEKIELEIERLEKIDEEKKLERAKNISQLEEESSYIPPEITKNRKKKLA